MLKWEIEASGEHWRWTSDTEEQLLLGMDERGGSSQIGSWVAVFLLDRFVIPVGCARTISNPGGVLATFREKFVMTNLAPNTDKIRKVFVVFTVMSRIAPYPPESIFRSIQAHSSIERTNLVPETCWWIYHWRSLFTCALANFGSNLSSSTWLRFHFISQSILSIVLHEFLMDIQCFFDFSAYYDNKPFARHPDYSFRLKWTFRTLNPMV